MFRPFVKMAKTKITFRFMKPVGFTLEGFGNFYPELKPVLATAENGVDMTRFPPHFGNRWVNGYDFNQEYSVELPDEEPRPIPSYIADIEDDATRAAFRVKSAEKAADAHASNNAHRDELARLEKAGKIKVVGDTFMDKRVERIMEPVTIPAAKAPPVKTPPATVDVVEDDSD